MSLATSRARLDGLTRELSARWAETKEHWLDAKSREFEQRFMDELLTTVNRTAATIHDLERTLAKVRNECQ
jgi:hypothetical protein